MSKERTVKDADVAAHVLRAVSGPLTSMRKVDDDILQSTPLEHTVGSTKKPSGRDRG